MLSWPIGCGNRYSALDNSRPPTTLYPSQTYLFLFLCFLFAKLSFLTPSLDSLRLPFLNASKIMGLQQASKTAIIKEQAERKFAFHTVTKEGERASSGTWARPHWQCKTVLAIVELPPKNRQRHSRWKVCSLPGLFLAYLWNGKTGGELLGIPGAEPPSCTGLLFLLLMGPIWNSSSGSY